MRWSVDLAARTGNALVTLQPSSVSMTRRLNAPASAEVTITLPGAFNVSPSSGVLRIWRRAPGESVSVPVFAGPVETVVDTGDADGVETIVISARDPFALMESYHQVSVDRVFTATPVGDIVADYVDNAHQLAETGLRMGSVTPSVKRDRTYEPGKQFAEIITQLAHVDDGFFFKVRPVNEGNVIGRLDITYPGSGVVRRVSLQSGAGTLGNITGYGITVTPPTNYVVAHGAGEAPNQTTAIAFNTPSLNTYGHRQVVINHTDVSVVATLEQHAREALRLAPVVTYTCELADPGGAAPVPMLWDDFDVGDTLGLYIRSTRLEVDAQVRVTEVTAAVDVEGNERITAITLQDPATRLYGVPTVVRGVRELDRRLATLERGGARA